MTKNMKYLIGLVVVILIACGIGFTVVHKSTTQELQAKEWSFKASKGDGLAQTAKFSEKSLTLSEAGLNDTYQYKVTKKNGSEQITFTSQDDNSNTRIFKIKKNSDEYQLIPINSLAKEDTGDVTLTPK
ncbi:hypothetical protein [Leuconostoc gasicomitatum]|jgi:uncharacterized protein YxeA|uniref:hypothetical protein n=1 Tax=Leuconostoc gasicomitatum TaxID=115778 RepID=UPI00074488AB|nr:hypothetical protein [Leuconostoc gasicomitatum]MBZ5972411.1 hypothetical protein [Leuconostoc gasicomitatum]CUR64585.1 Putative conjugal transfer protein [Leuconostoc gasicomitatum KG16-1]